MHDRAERFYVWVWRLNGLLILGLALAGTALAAVIAINIGVFNSQRRPEQQLSEVAGAKLGADELRLGDFQPVEGTPLLYAQLAAPSEYIGSGSSGPGYGRAHNLLFFDTVSKKAHWLLPTNDQTLESLSLLMDPPRYLYRVESRDEQVIGMLLEIQDRHPDAPAKDSTRRLVIAAPDGRDLTPIAESTQGLLGFHHQSKSSLFVFYVSSGTARVLDVDPSTRKVRSDEALEAQ